MAHHQKNKARLIHRIQLMLMIPFVCLFAHNAFSDELEPNSGIYGVWLEDCPPEPGTPFAIFFGESKVCWISDEISCSGIEYKHYDNMVSARPSGFMESYFLYPDGDTMTVTFMGGGATGCVTRVTDEARRRELCGDDSEGGCG